MFWEILGLCRFLAVRLINICKKETSSPDLLVFVFSFPPFPQQKYIAQVLQEQALEENVSGNGAEYSQGSSQDDDLIIPGPVINEADFQSGEDSLIDNEVHQ